LAYEGRKVMGSSLYLPRECALYLGSFLVSTPIALLDRFLAHPSREPEYRQGRSHGDFVRNLSEIPGLSFMTPAWLREMLETRLQAAGG
jgi:lipoate-protein ligase A